MKENLSLSVWENEEGQPLAGRQRTAYQQQGRDLMFESYRITFQENSQLHHGGQDEARMIQGEGWTSAIFFHPWP